MACMAPPPRSHLAHEVRLKGAGRVVPLEALAVPVPQLQAVLLLAVLVAEVVRLAGVPVGEGDGAARGHPEEGALLGLVRARRPEVLVAQTWGKTRAFSLGDFQVMMRMCSVCMHV